MQRRSPHYTDFYFNNASTPEGQRLASLNIGIQNDPLYLTGAQRGAGEEFVSMGEERTENYTHFLDDPIDAILGIPSAIVDGITHYVDTIKAKDLADQNKNTLHGLAILQGNAEAAGYIQGSDAARFAGDMSAGAAGILLGSGIWLRYSDLVDWNKVTVLTDDVTSSAERAATGVKGVSSGAESANAQSALKAKLSGLEKAQQNAATTRQLPDGRVRYYTQEVPARTEGPTRGASFVTEHNPKTGNVRQWMESYNHSGQVNRVHPKSINGQTVNSQHYPPTARELGL